MGRQPLTVALICLFEHMIGHYILHAMKAFSANSPRLHRIIRRYIGQRGVCILLPYICIWWSKLHNCTSCTLTYEERIRRQGDYPLKLLMTSMALKRRDMQYAIGRWRNEKVLSVLIPWKPYQISGLAAFRREWLLTPICLEIYVDNISIAGYIKMSARSIFFRKLETLPANSKSAWIT